MRHTSSTLLKDVHSENQYATVCWQCKTYSSTDPVSAAKPCPVRMKYWSATDMTLHAGYRLLACSVLMLPEHLKTCSLHQLCSNSNAAVYMSRNFGHWVSAAGEMYSMTVVPCASSLCVMNIRQTDARVEAILSDFVQLRQEAGQAGAQVSFLNVSMAFLCLMCYRYTAQSPWCVAILA